LCIGEMLSVAVASSSSSLLPNALQPTTKPSVDSPFAPHWKLAPRQYVARRLAADSSPLTIDGDLEKREWTEVEWSEPFGDIRGIADSPKEAQPTDTQRTRMKMRWDDEYLYVAAHLASDFPVLASFTKRNEPIFTEDSDFEVFVDPAATTHAYKELEINALNTVWNLMLNRPYGDDGSEHSARVAKVGEQKYWEVTGLKTAVKVVKGELNAKGGAEWTVELALHHDDTLAGQPQFASRPAVGGLWRINFSRVEKKGDINWVWSPQVVWDANRSKHVGMVAMHLPEAWGWVQFAPAEGAAPLRDVTWPARLAALNLYYAQHLYMSKTGNFSTSAAALQPYLDAEITSPFQLAVEARANVTFNATVTYGTPPDELRVRVREDRLVRVVDGSSHAACASNACSSPCALDPC